MKKSDSKFYLAPLQLLSNFENPSSNPLQRPESGDFDTENAYMQEAACDSVNHTGSRLWQVNSCAFSLQPMKGRYYTANEKFF